MLKTIITGINAQKSLQNGVNIVSNLVKTTLGPKGKNVVLDRKFLTPLITNDGATIAKEVVLEDPYENMGVKLINEVCQKTNDVSGDGTTTAIVLAQALLNEGLKQLSNGFNAIDINLGIKKTTDSAKKNKTVRIFFTVLFYHIKIIKSTNQCFLLQFSLEEQQHICLVPSLYLLFQPSRFVEERCGLFFFRLLSLAQV